MTIVQKIRLANKYLARFDTSWETLEDVNTLDGCNTIEEIEDACDERMEESGWYMEGDNEV